MKGLGSLFPSRSALSADEIRDLAIRHVLSDPSDPRTSAVTGALLAIYAAIWRRDLETPLRAVSDAAEARTLLARFFVEGYVRRRPSEPEEALAYFVWPAALPQSLPHYPRDFLVRLGVALGLQAAGRIAEWRRAEAPGNN